MESGGGREQSRPLTAEEEALKRNTDCVYFLASPLTCKKGTECEYRHSEGARVNPRDCWYWLNGNCLNPKCMFRHPPLDGLIGMLGTTELAPPPSQTVALTHVPAAHGPAGFSLNKQNVPCYYFQKGHCLKGDRCPFLHGPQQKDNSVPQQYKSPPDPVSPLKKESWCLEERTSQQSICKADVDKTVEMPLAPVKPAGKSENVLNEGFAIKETVSPYPSEDGLPRFPESNVPVSTGIAQGWPRSRQSQCIDDYLENAREADEFLRESSPGFDVLVNNNLEDSEYFGDEGDFEREPVQDARNPNHVSDFDYHHSDYESVPSFERDQYNGVGVHDRYGRLDDWHSWEQQRTTSERILERASMHEKKMLQGEERYHDIAAADLRHRLLKQRRLNGLKSTFSPDHCGRLYRRHNYFVDEERYHAHHACRGHQRFPMESSISSRLQGRITLPARFSPDRPVDLQSERNRDKGRHQERSSPVRPVNYKGRHHDKIKRRPVFSDVRNAGVQPIGIEEADSLNFAGPKCLAELKGAKLSENLQDQKKIKLAKPLGHQESDGFLSFEGPKPLSVILKRKRENAPGNGANCCNGYKNTERDNVGGIGSSVLAATEREDNYTANCSKDSKVAGVNEEKEVGIIPIEGEALPNDGQTSAGGNTHEVEDGMTAGATDDQELENYGCRDGESDYEEVEDEEFKPEDVEDEEDDEDDFAKKVGVMFS